MAITLLQSKSISGSQTASFNSDVPAGSLLVVGKRASQAATISDTVNGLWSLAVGIATGASGIWFFKNCAFTPAATVITATGGNSDWIIAAYSGIDTVNPLDQTNNNSGTSAGYNAGSITTTAPAELLLSNVANSTANSLVDTPGAGWADLAGGSNGNVFLAAQIVSSIGTYSNAGSYNSSVTWGAVIASFKAFVAPVSGVYSVPDCRTAPAGPNASRTVQGTKIYDVQTSSNHIIPPTDSRISVNIPTDSRAAGQAPQNSRTPGTFGPGVN